MAQTHSIVMATQVLTFTGNALNTETVVIGGKTYTFQTTLTNSDGNVLIGATTADSITNLVAAIGLGAGSGTLYAAATTRNERVEVISSTATTITVGSPGSVGNLVATTETLTNGSWGAGTLAGGSGNVSFAIRELLRLNQVNSEVAYELKRLTAAAD